MDDSVRVLAGFANGLLGYKEYLELLDSGQLSEQLIELMPYNLLESYVHKNKLTMLEQLCVMDELRAWGACCNLMSHQFAKAKIAAFDGLKLNLISAFSGVLLEDGITLAQANSMDCYQSEEEQATARLKDINSSWQNYSKQDLEGFTSILYLDEKGFAYYIPAYLIWCMDNFFREPYSNIASETFSAFDPKLSGFSIRIKALNPAQRKLVKKFLWLFAVHSDLYRETIVLGIQSF